jgi:hypothetical protein
MFLCLLTAGGHLSGCLKVLFVVLNTHQCTRWTAFHELLVMGRFAAFYVCCVELSCRDRVGGPHVAPRVAQVDVKLVNDDDDDDDDCDDDGVLMLLRGGALFRLRLGIVRAAV